MPVYLLSEELLFPPPEGASEEGVVAIGGDLRPERLVLAYSQGIFPWPTEGFPLLWFSPDPRFALVPGEVHLHRSLRKTVRRNPYRFTSDEAFGEVIRACADIPRPVARTRRTEYVLNMCGTKLQLVGNQNDIRLNFPGPANKTLFTGRFNLLAGTHA